MTEEGLPLWSPALLSFPLDLIVCQQGAKMCHPGRFQKPGCRHTRSSTLIIRQRAANEGQTSSERPGAADNFNLQLRCLRSLCVVALSSSSSPSSSRPCLPPVLPLVRSSAEPICGQGPAVPGRRACPARCPAETPCEGGPTPPRPRPPSCSSRPRAGWLAEPGLAVFSGLLRPSISTNVCWRGPLRARRSS